MQGHEVELELQLIEKVKKGERSAFDSLVDKYKEKAFALAFNMVGNYEDAKDVLQDAFVRAYVNIKDFRGSSNFYTWFYRILVNLCRDFLRRRTTVKRVFVSPQMAEGEGERNIEVADERPNPLETTLNEEVKQMIDEAMNLLSEKQRMAFILKHIQGLKLSEVAAILNCRESTVKVHLFRAMRNLQKSLSPYLLTAGGN
ncbi:MAG: RNA polymerase sigma factor [Candidatus Omnitrophota bacterium]